VTEFSANVIQSSVRHGKCRDDAAALFAIFLRNVGLGPVHTAGRPLIKHGCRGKFLLLPGIFPLKIENHFQKISQKILQSCVLNLLLPWVHGYWIPRSSVSTKPALFRDPMCPTFRVGPMSALPPKADIRTEPRNVRFVPKADINAPLPSTTFSPHLSVVASSQPLGRRPASWPR
jgi:hypothetical protein